MPEQTDGAGADAPDGSDAFADDNGGIGASCGVVVKQVAFSHARTAIPLGHRLAVSVIVAVQPPGLPAGQLAVGKYRHYDAALGHSAVRLGPDAISDLQCV